MHSPILRRNLIYTHQSCFGLPKRDRDLENHGHMEVSYTLGPKPDLLSGCLGGPRVGRFTKVGDREKKIPKW